MDTNDRYVVCPYNKAHSILSRKMQFHLQKCRLQHPGSEKHTCPFNTTHVINKVELAYHIEECPDRIQHDKMVFKMGPARSQNLPTSKFVEPEIDDETWNIDSDSESVLDKVKEENQTKPTLTNKICAPRSERIAHKQQERRRFIDVLHNTPKDAQKEQESNSNFANPEVPPPLVETGNLQNFPPTEKVTSSSYNEIRQINPVINNGAIPRNPRNPWGARPQPVWQEQESMVSPVDDRTGNDIGQVSTTLQHMNLGQQRNPTNPWQTSTKPQGNKVVVNNEDDFPGLPLSTGRGRGRRLRN